MGRGNDKPKVENILTKKFTDLKDFPASQKISIFQPGSLLGEDDILQRDYHSTSVQCSTKKGTVFVMTRAWFNRLRKSEQSWNKVEKSVAYR